MIAAYEIFTWDNHTFTVSGWGLSIIIALILVFFAFAERDRL
jgi:hypothetical protein